MHACMHTDRQIGRYKDRPTDGRSDGTAGRTDGRTEKHAYRHQARGTLSIKYTVYRLHTCRPGKRERERASKKESGESRHGHRLGCECARTSIHLCVYGVGRPANTIQLHATKTNQHKAQELLVMQHLISRELNSECKILMPM